MKLAIVIVALLCAFAAAIVGGLVRHMAIDAAGQGVLLLDATTSKECRDGGGCAAWSERELRAFAQTIAKQTYVQAKAGCNRKDL